MKFLLQVVSVLCTYACLCLAVPFIDSLRNYFSQFGRVVECNIMKDASGTSRGFGFLKFADPKDVNTIMVREHWLDGKVVRVSNYRRAIERSCRC